jgi:hypothetical protein
MPVEYSSIKMTGGLPESQLAQSVIRYGDGRTYQRDCESQFSLIAT